MAQYKPDTCAYCKTDTWCEQRHNGKPQCRACKVEAFYERYLYPPLGLTLMGWHRTVLRSIFGTVNVKDGRRRYRRAYVSTAKQNGKSFITAGLPLYHILMEDELNPEAYGSAAAKEQAGIVFKAAAMLVNANPDLRARLKVLPSTKRIIRRDGGGMYQVLSADGNVQDGIRPSLNIRDEMHRWRNAGAETLYDVTTKGQISRNEPIDIAITNAKIKADPEYWKSREARVAANPSHEDLGGFLKDTAIVAELEKAITQPANRSKYLRYHLNLPVTSLQEPIIEMAKWIACGDPESKDPVDLRKWPEMDVELLIRKWGLIEKPCFVGVDASWTTDMTAVVIGFPPEEDWGVWTVIPFFFVPVEKVPDIERICRVPIQGWINQGFITATPGNMIDMRAVTDRIKWAAEMFDVIEVAYDPAGNMRVVAADLYDNDGITCVEVPQNFMTLSQPTKQLLGLILDRKLRHGNQPVFNWHAGCLQLQYDRKDNCQPSKPERLKNSKRIDGVAAFVDILNRAPIAEQNTVRYTGLRSIG
jgi:phage terminase large subunit-like protein